MFRAFAVVLQICAQDLPKADPNDALEIEPPLLIKDGKPLAPLTSDRPERKSLDELSTALERARRAAAGAERQFRAGIISKAQAEDRGLRVARVESELANAQLQQAEEELEGAKQQHERGEISQAQLEESAAATSRAKEAVRVADINRQRAELEAARNNLRRQQKLLALGSGRRGDVDRAEAKLSELSQPKEYR